MPSCKHNTNYKAEVKEMIRSSNDEKFFASSDRRENASHKRIHSISNSPYATANNFRQAQQFREVV